MHDELVFEVRTQDVQRVASIVKECMEGAVVLNVPLSVKLSTGSTWGCLSPLALMDSSGGSDNGPHTGSISNPNSSRTGPASASTASGNNGKECSPDPAADHFSLYHTVMSRANSLLPSSTVNATATTASSSGLFAPSAAAAGVMHNSALYPLIHQRAAANPNLPPSQISNNNISGGTNSAHGLSLPIVRDLFGRD